MRQGIPFGPELSEDPKNEHDRGLAFVCYQTDITAAFEALQMSESRAYLTMLH
ncbi:hypothetical protein [Escherichia coli]|uniref:hypothetical protein n=1 Tax=Escherichia coli TaxID=562 RepID=UPI0034D98188